MVSSLQTPKPHAVCVPYPAQGHVSPFMQLAKLLRCSGFHITFVNTEFNHNRLAKSLGPDFVKGLPDFQFESIPDGLPPSDKDATQDIPQLCDSTRKNCYEPFKELVKKLNSSPEVPPVSCVVADGVMGFVGRVASDLGIQELQFWTASACGLVGYLQYDELVKRGLVPFKDENFTDGTLDASLDWISGMKDVRLKDIPSFIRVTDLNDIMFNFMGSEAQNCLRSSTIIINSFQDLDTEALDTLRATNPNIYSIGPLHLLGRHFPEKENGFKESGSSLWKNDTECMKWLDKWEPSSVIYVNYGSITVMSEHHLKEFAWGIANSKLPFLWIMRPDVVMGDESINLPQEFLDEVKGRGYITSWCFQEQVLAHPSIGIFLTHCGWNSTIEGISSGAPLICWPFFAEQQTNCRYACKTWGIGMEINHDVKRGEITALVNEMMEGEKGKEMRQKSLEWKKKAIKETGIGGSSYNNFHKLVKEVLHHNVA
ncbi:linamarin synthase 1-like [Lotus japonicus]|uniref:linamarin synthase 1-like n=1 Tax=Lotus japonicus TaxID=34305 RepID=UPI0025892CF3|nr:linamarin synthase 1-like [Lotus japonicus]